MNRKSKSTKKKSTLPFSGCSGFYTFSDEVHCEVIGSDREFTIEDCKKCNCSCNKYKKTVSDKTNMSELLPEGHYL